MMCKSNVFAGWSRKRRRSSDCAAMSSSVTAPYTCLIYMKPHIHDEDMEETYLIFKSNVLTSWSGKRWRS